MKFFSNASGLMIGFSVMIGLISCNQPTTKSAASDKKSLSLKDSLQKYVDERLDIYEKVKLTTNINDLSSNDREILPLLIQAAQIMDDIYWKQVYPNRDSLLNTVKDEKTKSFIMINYGPWDRLNGDKPFVAGIGPKPDALNFYPAGMTKEALAKSEVKDKYGSYSVIREEMPGKYMSVPYHIIYALNFKKQLLY